MSGKASSKQRALRNLLVIGIAVFALLLPTVASADLATFSSRAPGSGAATTNTRPSIGVTVYDRHGIKGSSSVYMTLDNRVVSPSRMYVVTGGFDPAHPDYRRMKLSFRPSTALSVGTHKVYVRVKCRSGYTSKTTWYFKVTGAEAPYSATFSVPAPASASSSYVSTPSVSVKIYDKYGVYGLGSYALTVDGVALPTTIRYAVNGVYTGFTLSSRVSTALSTGTHKFAATVTDLHAHATNYSWTYTVLAPVIVYEEMPYAGTACADCHVGYPSTHPMTNCALCHGPGRPIAGTAYGPASTSAHTLACSMSPCHRTPQPFPHVLGDCSTCHNGQWTGIPASHTLNVPDLHRTTSVFCTSNGCHQASLTMEHYRYTLNGARLSCGTCHGSTDAKIQAAIAAHNTDCTGCHDLATIVHPGTGIAHTASNDCIAAGCHANDVTVIHGAAGGPGCVACHASQRIPSTDCTTCHASGTFHLKMGTSHTLPSGGCIQSGCHSPSLDAASLHKNVCSRCHGGSAAPTTNCTTCHGDAVLTLHPGATASHTAALVECTTSSCHGTLVTDIHKKDGTFRCSACHKGDGSTPTTTCSTCHAGDVSAVHSAAASKHAAPAISCIGAACHTTDVSQIHVKNGVSKCAACHAPNVVPTTDCTQCHLGEISTIHSAAGPYHVASLATCVADGCHANDVTKIHVNKDSSADCGACHGGSVPPATTNCTACHAGDVTQLHSYADPLHVPYTGFCQTVCHAQNVATIHADTTKKCAACHVSGLPKSTRCSDCHSGTVRDLHAIAASQHITVPGTCVTSKCHSTDVISIHDPAGDGSGCVDCHGLNKTASLDCTTCHGTSVLGLHPTAAGKHSSPTGTSCIASVCHETDVTAIHGHPGGPGCYACHADNKTPSTTCSNCHSTDISVLHQKADASHTVAAGSGCSTPTCHNSGNVSVIHTKAGVQHCEACHAVNVTASTVCANCHAPANIPTVHASADTSHTATLATCVLDGCHGSNVAVLHAQSPGCGVCHGANAPTTLNCVTGGCHSSNLNIVHANAAIAHTALAGYCVRSNCHAGDVTVIHDANGTGPGCKACHNNPDHLPSATCTDCHPATDALVHAAADTTHTVTQTTCAGYTGASPCHHARVDSIHRTAPAGCMSCHGANVTPSTVCADCHTGSNAPTHTSATSLHLATNGLCSNSACHPVDVSAIHANSASSCLACHDPKKTPSTDCSTCHSGDPLIFHTQAAAAHATPTSSCTVAGCHDRSTVTSIHQAVGCTVCHDPSKVLTKTCTTTYCHGHDYTAIHSKGTTPHAAVSGICLSSGCHSGDAVALHTTQIGSVTPPGCRACHDNPDHATSTVCTDCHDATPQAAHAPYVGTKHDPIQGMACTASPGCHNASVASTHNAPAGTFGPTAGPGCTPCHTTGPLTVDCTVCHTTTANTPVHASAETSHTAPTGTCVKDGCHGSNVTLIHIKNGVMHCEACHNTDVGPSLNCQGCHFSDFTSEHPAPVDKHTSTDVNSAWCVKSGCHSTNVATIHTTSANGVIVPPSCAACHSDNQTPSTDCSSSGCHPLGVPNNHVAPTVPHTSTDSCTSLCHSANVATLHSNPTGTAVAPGCVACHVYGKAHSTTCADCHTSGTYHGAASSKHTTSVSCTAAGCHATSGSTTSGDVSLIHVKSGVQHCEACHADGKMPTTDCSNALCHGTIAGDHTAAHAQCNNCHAGDPNWSCASGGDCHGTQHWSGPTIGVANCTTCHTGAGKTWTHPGEGGACGCHGDYGIGSWTMAW